MRVLMTTDAVGGVWTYSLALARGLCSEGWSVTLVVLGPSPDVAPRQDVAEIDGCTLLLTDLPLDWKTNDVEAVEQSDRTGVAYGQSVSVGEHLGGRRLTKKNN